MNADQARALLATGPNERVAILAARPSDQALAQTLVALANASGGTIFIPLGPDDRPDDTLVDWAIGVTLSCDPPLIIPLPEFATVDGRTYLTLEVPPGLPHVYAHDGIYWCYDGSTSVALGPRHLRELLLQRTGPSQESLPVPNATLDDIDWAAVRAYAASLPARPAIPTQELLRRRGGLDDTSTPTYAGILLFGREPQRFLPAAEVLLVRYPGTSMGDVFLKQVARGTLPQQIRQAEAFVIANMRHGARIDALARDERPEYPPAVVRESIVNAVAHRDYSVRGEEIRILLFADRLEVYSPGRLAGHVTLENLAHERFARNEVLVQCLSDMGFVERLGYGIDRMMRLMQAEGLPTPAFEETANGFRVTLRGHGDRLIERRPDGFQWSALALNPRQEKAVAHTAEHGRITNRDLQDLCPDVSPETIRRDLADLVDQDVLIKIGDKRATFYILKK